MSLLDNLATIVSNTIQSVGKFLSDSTVTVLSKAKALKFFREIIGELKDSLEVPNDILIKTLSVGRFYLFSYKSKLFSEGRLPFYDAYPMILVLSQSKKYFLGFNIHYLTPKQKNAFFKKMITKFPDAFLNDSRCFPISWKILKSIMGNKKYIKNAIKLYRKDHLLRIKGLMVSRIKTPTQIIESAKFVSPLWVGITFNEVQKRIKRNDLYNRK